MAEANSDKPNTHSHEALVLDPQNASVRSSRFKYYIHDGIDACRLELKGELGGAEIPELTGCWRTAKTTLGKRKLILDLRALKSIDEAGRGWVTSMTEQGAVCLPSSVFEVVPSQNSKVATAACENPSRENTRTSGRVKKLLAIFRAFRFSSAESSTQAQ